jgi:PAS domain S-box-containing protein
MEGKSMANDILKKLHEGEANPGYWNWNLSTNELNGSPEYYRILGYETGRYPPGYEAFQARLHPGDKETVNRALGEALDKDTRYDMDYRVIWPDGTIHEVHSEADIPLKDAAGKRFLLFGLIRENTGKPKAEAKPHWSKKRAEIFSEKTAELLQCQANVVEHVSDAIISTDPGFIIISWNRAAEQVFGWTATEAIGKHADELLKTRFIDRSYEEALSQLMKLGRVEAEVLLEHKDGRILNVLSIFSIFKNNKGAITGTVGIMRDITFENYCAGLDRYYEARPFCPKPGWFSAVFVGIAQRKLVEKALRENAEKMKAVFEQAAVGINQVGLDGRYINVNPKFCDKSGYTKDELINLTVWDLYHPSYHRWDRERMQKLLTGEISTYTGEMQLRRKDGNYLWVNLTASLVRNDNEPAYFIRIVEDISYRKQMEKALQEKQDELAAANDELRAQHEELTAVNEELQTQQEELIAINEELQAQTEKFNTAYQELQRQAAEIRECGEIATRARDQAERRAAELNAIISSIAAGVIIYDHMGNIFRMNEIARNVFGHPGDDYNGPSGDYHTKINLCKADGTPFEDGETPLCRALQGEIIRDEEVMITRIPGKPVWLSETLAPIYNQNQTLIGAILIFSDITARKRKLEDLLASERELLKVTLNSLGEGVVTVDSDERVILINESAAKLTGYSQAEATGQPLNKILYVCDDKTSELIVVNTSLRISGSPILVTRDLREVPVAIHSSPIKTTGSRVIGTVIVFQDISEKQRTERELLKAEKLESLGILAGGIAHDFNNILAAILSNIQLAMRKMEKNEDIHKYLLNTVETTRKASDLTKQLLTFSKGGDPVKKDAALNELIKDTTEFVLRGANIKAEFTIPDDLWAASIDEGQISQVIYNLVINAKQAMPRGGIIHISAENITIGGNSRFTPGNYVKIVVTDHGTGISAENISKIFDPFFTTKKDGNGLGLATSYSIINRHNGYLEAESKENNGTSFLIYLPASGRQVARNEPQVEVAVSGVGFRILFMDDEEKILNAVGEMLNDSYGYQVVLVTDGMKAIESYKRAKEAGEPFDVAVMDLTVPGGMGGQEAVAHLRDYDPNIKAIVSSGYANDPIIADYERYGFCGVVSKPYKINELNEVLYKVINPDQLPLKLTFE